MIVSRQLRRIAGRKASGFIGGLVCICLMTAVSYADGAAEHWIATSNTATAVTGNVTFSATRLTFQNGRSLELSPIDPVPGFKAMGDAVNASLYRVTAPADVLLKNGNHLCGGGRSTQRVTYIAIWHPTALPGDKAPRSMAAFSSKEPPRSTSDAASCGLYNYEAGG